MRRVRIERDSFFDIVLTLALGLSLTVIFAVTVSPVYGYSLTGAGAAVNLVPFQVLESVKDNPANFYGNILLFIPVGALPMLLWKKFRKLPVTLLWGAGLSLVIETLQLFCARGTDIDDVLLNTAGTFWGFLLGCAILKMSPQLQKNVHVRRKGSMGQPAALAALVLLAVFAKGPVLKKPDGAALPPQEEVKITAPDAFAHVELAAQNAYFIEAGTGTVLYEKESDVRIAPASTAKMLTALTALGCCKEDDEVTVGKEVGRIAKDASRAWLAPGNKLTVRQLLDAMLLPSGNDAAYALAVYAGRQLLKDDAASIDEALAAFVEAMNEKAAEVGATQSSFISPDGYDADGQYTTAYDLAQIAKAFEGSDTLKNIAASCRITDVWLSGQDVTYDNTNELLNPDSPYYFKEATGLKTGTSEEAGCCLVSCATIGGELYIAVVMGATEEGRWLDSMTLYGTLS